MISSSVFIDLFNIFFYETPFTDKMTLAILLQKEKIKKKNGALQKPSFNLPQSVLNKISQPMKPRIQDLEE